MKAIIVAPSDQTFTRLDSGTAASTLLEILNGIGRSSPRDLFAELLATMPEDMLKLAMTAKPSGLSRDNADITDV